MRKFRSFVGDSRGVAAIEMAFIMPFLLFLYFGLVDLTALISTTRKINYAASVVGDLVTQGPPLDAPPPATSDTFTPTIIQDFYKAAEMVMAPTPLSKIRIEVYDYHKGKDTQNTPTNMWKSSNGGPGSCGTPSTLDMLPLMADGNDLIVTEVCTTYSPYIASFLGSQILGATSFPLSSQIVLRPRQTDQLKCSTAPNC